MQHFLDDPGNAEIVGIIVGIVEEDELFTLAPLQSGSFNFNGNGPVIKVELIKVRMKLYGVSSPVLELKARSVQDAFKHDLGSLTIKVGNKLLRRMETSIDGSSYDFGLNTPYLVGADRC